ncbi:MAG TPA: vitamin B12 dependent-methionine synthase activation domain-containing protein [Rectinemataceae bacterium]|nr:vitamin B12 dependent-methionine synthase activation domain-containing protein [Rectinemataceae bacterium]
MARKIPSPTLIDASGTGSKRIEEFVGLVNSGTAGLSIARMHSGEGWSEPGQRPDFDEYTLVIEGSLRVETEEAIFDLVKGEAVIAGAGEWVRYSSPRSGGADYISVCLPAFSPETVHRDDEAPAAAASRGSLHPTAADPTTEPRVEGPTEVSYRLDELTPYIDWTRFFQARGLKGHYPGILDDKVEGSMAERLLDEARALLRRAQADGLLDVKGVSGFFPASGEGDDILIWADEGRDRLRSRVPCLRQTSPDGGRGSCLSDWLSPLASGKRDWVGAYAVTAGLGLEASVSSMAARNDGYDAAMLSLLAERVAQAAAEKMHEEVRKTWWGYAPDENLPAYRLFHRAYRGIRASPGKAPCPDPRERRLIFELLDVPRRTGMSLDEACSLVPAASACGWYFSHPAAAPFAVGRISREEAERYAARRGESLEETEDWLKNELGYTPPLTAAASHKEGA